MSLVSALLLDPYPFEVWIAKRTDGIKGDGTLNSPFNAVTAADFDTLMNGFSANTRVHLGPGAFTTQGYYDGAPATYGWQPKAGMKITGAGIDVTTIQLAGGLAANNHYFAIGHALANGTQPNSLDFCAVSDLTIDCNLQNQANSVACGAVRLMGNHVHISRVKARNWGNKLPGKSSFVFAVITADPESVVSVADAGIEDCIAVEPASGTTDEVLILHAGGKLRRADGTDYDATQSLEGHGTAPFIRNCFVDCDANGTLGSDSDYRSKLRGLSMGACRGGVIEGNQLHNTWFGGPYLVKWSARSIWVRNNS